MTASIAQTSLKGQWDASSLAMLERFQDKIPAIKQLIVANQRTAQGWQYAASNWYDAFSAQEDALGRGLTTSDYYNVFDELHHAFEKVEGKGALYLEDQCEAMASLRRDLTGISLKEPVKAVIASIFDDIKQGLIRLGSFDDRQDAVRDYLAKVLSADAETERPASYTYAEDAPRSNQVLALHLKGWSDQVCDMSFEASQAVTFFDRAATNLKNLGAYIVDLQPHNEVKASAQSRRPHSNPTTVEQLARHL